MLSRLLTAVYTVPSGATARPSPFRTPFSTTLRSAPEGLTDSIVARGGFMDRSPGVAFDALPTLNQTVPSAVTVTSLSRCTSSPDGSWSGRLPATTVRKPLTPFVPQDQRSISSDSPT